MKSKIRDVTVDVRRQSSEIVDEVKLYTPQIKFDSLSLSLFASICIHHNYPVLLQINIDWMNFNLLFLSLSPHMKKVTVFELLHGGGADALIAISKHVKFAMDKSFELKTSSGTSSSHVVLLEEDLLPSLDFLYFFESTAW
jgi:hypothetical protein